MKPHQAIREVDCVMLMAGCKLYIPSSATKYFNLLMWCLSTISMYVQMVEYALRFPVPEGQLLYGIANISYIVFSVMAHSWFTFRRVQIIAYYERCYNELSPYHQLKLRRIGKWLAGYTAVCSVGVVLHIGYIYCQQFKSTVLAWKLAYLVVRCVYGMWTARTSMQYTFFAAVHCYAYDTFLNQLKALVSKPVANFKALTLTLVKLNSLRSDFDSLFNLFPALWLLLLLINASGFICLFKAQNVPEGILFIEWPLFGMWVTNISIALGYVIKANYDYRNKVSEISQRLLKSPNKYCECVAFVNELKNQPQLTGCYQFEITSMLLLNYLASFLSFTILFLQIGA